MSCLQFLLTFLIYDRTLTVESSPPFRPIGKASNFQIIENKGIRRTSNRECQILKIMQNQALRRTLNYHDRTIIHHYAFVAYQ